MSIVENTTSRQTRRFSKWEGLAGGALVAAAVFAATPKPAHGQTSVTYTGTGGTTTNPNSASAASWFNTANWNTQGTGTGTLPESNLANANNSSMPSVGVLFDPAHDSNTPGGPNANYVANLYNVQGSFYISSDPGTVIAPNKLTIGSGTMIVGTITVGRDAPGILALNGGTFITAAGALRIQGSNRSTVLGTGTFEYHGGNLESLQGVQVGSGVTGAGVVLTSAGVGYFVVYNDGPDGAILSQNGFQFASNTNQHGTIGIVEFHYDNNSGGIAGVRPIQTNWNDGNAQVGQGILHLNNNTNASSRLNLVLDAAPSLINARVQNLGLFDETLITAGNMLSVSTYPKAFYSVDGSTVFTQGATISANFAGHTYSWTISYSGQINFSNTATSAYSPTAIQATGGDDIVLIGVAVPEPSSLALLGATSGLILSRRRSRKERNANTASSI
jgi:hypothetical protein